MKTKLFGFFLVLVASIGTIFASDTSIDGIWYDFNYNTKEAAVSYQGSDRSSCSNEYTGSVVIPSSVTYDSINFSVTSIGISAFYDCDGLTSVTIPNSVTSIGISAFHDCDRLTSVTIPNSVTSIGGSAFRGCRGLTSVTIPNSVTSIDIYTFYGCSGLTSVTIPNSVTSIGYHAFSACSRLTSVTIPNSVTSIGSSAFSSCSGLTSVTISNSVTSIRHDAFSGCSSLTSVTIPNSVTSIENDAFYGCSGLTSVTIPNSVTSIGTDAFYGCSGLTSVYISDLTAWCSINFRNPNSNPLFYAKHLFIGDTEVTDLIIPNSVTSIGRYTFYGCSGLTSVIIPYSVTSIGYSAFYSCHGLMNLELLSKTPPALAAEAFSSCNNLSAIYVPCGTLDEYKSKWSSYISLIKYFNYEIVTDINIEVAGTIETPQSVCDTIMTAISNYGYHFVQWSDGIKDNPRLIELTQDTTFTAEFALDVTGACGDNNELTWKYDSISHTLSISGEGTLNSNYTFGLQAPTQTEKLVIEEGVTSIGNSAFRDMCATITSLSLPSSLTSIGDSAFMGLENRKFNMLVLPNTIISIGNHAFDGASYLQEIYFGSSLEEIGAYAFNGCTRVKKMTCLAEITPNVGTNGLLSISSLAELYVPNDYLFDYQLDNNWKRFILKPLGATETTTNDVNVEPGDNTAVFTWPTNNNAASYTIEITKDGEVFCTLIFNANGQLTGIAFAPSSNGQSHAPSAILTANGMQFTVTGLDVATNYAFSLTTKDSAGVVIASYSGTFGTTGAPQGIDNPSANFGGSRKLIRNGQIFILRGDKTYTLTGQEIK